MQKEFLMEMLNQNKATSISVFDKITNENADVRLNQQTASIGFIYRHVGETINLFGLFFGIKAQVQNTTMGKADEGQGRNVEESRLMVEQGFKMLHQLIEDTPDSVWFEMVDTPFFGKVSKARLFSHILFHNSHHAGQVVLSLRRGDTLS